MKAAGASPTSCTLAGRSWRGKDRNHQIAARLVRAHKLIVTEELTAPA
jgi:hypothetical protein